MRCSTPSRRQTSSNSFVTALQVYSVIAVCFLVVGHSDQMCTKGKHTRRLTCIRRQYRRIYHWATWAMPPFELRKNLAYGKKCNQNAPFSGKNLKNFLGRGHSTGAAPLSEILNTPLSTTLFLAQGVRKQGTAESTRAV